MRKKRIKILVKTDKKIKNALFYSSKLKQKFKKLNKIHSTSYIFRKNVYNRLEEKGEL